MARGDANGGKPVELAIMLAAGVTLLGTVASGVDGASLAATLLGLTSATTTLLGFLQRWLRPRMSWFEHGYHAGWADAAHEFAVYPTPSPTGGGSGAGRVVVPMRRQP